MIQLDTIIRGYLLDKGLSTESAEYQRLYQIGTRGLKDLNADVTGSPITIPVVPDLNGTIHLPDDFLNIVSIGIVNANGELIDLGYEPSLAPPLNPNDCGNDGKFPATATPSAVNNPQYFVGTAGNGLPTTQHINEHGQSIGRFYGAGGRVGIGQYALNRDLNMIYTANLISGQLVLQYLSNIGREGKDFVVHDFAEEPLYAYIEWKRSALKTSIPRQEKMALMQEYYRVKMNLRIRLMARNTKVISQYSRKNSKSIKS